MKCKECGKTVGRRQRNVRYCTECRKSAYEKLPRNNKIEWFLEPNSIGVAYMGQQGISVRCVNCGEWIELTGSTIMTRDDEDGEPCCSEKCLTEHDEKAMEV